MVPSPPPAITVATPNFRASSTYRAASPFSQVTRTWIVIPSSRNSIIASRKGRLSVLLPLRISKLAGNSAMIVCAFMIGL
ncbi:Uncharacterised protein [Shigella sonnei]|nr:Uncharacterised protein [Shigella sonnei]